LFALGTLDTLVVDGIVWN